jgi:hypothetical protein
VPDRKIAGARITGDAVLSYAAILGLVSPACRLIQRLYQNRGVEKEIVGARITGDAVLGYAAILGLVSPACRLLQRLYRNRGVEKEIVGARITGDAVLGYAAILDFVSPAMQASTAHLSKPRCWKGNCRTLHRRLPLAVRACL